MKIIVNGQKKSFSDSPTLKEAVEQFSQCPLRVIAEVNGTIIKQTQWEQTTLNDNDTVELVGFVGGG